MTAPIHKIHIENWQYRIIIKACSIWLKLFHFEFFGTSNSGLLHTLTMFSLIGAKFIKSPVLFLVQDTTLPK